MRLPMLVGVSFARAPFTAVLLEVPVGGPPDHHDDGR